MQALRVRRLITRDFEEAWKKVCQFFFIFIILTFVSSSVLMILKQRCPTHSAIPWLGNEVISATRNRECLWTNI